MLFRSPGYALPVFSALGNITSVSPTSGSLAGGRVVTIDGWGFSNTTRVTVGTTPCQVESSEYSQIVCTTGPSESGEEYSADIEVFNSVEGRPKLILSSGSDSAYSRAYYTDEQTGSVVDLLFTVTDGLSVVTMDLDFFGASSSVRTYDTENSADDADELANFLSTLEIGRAHV